MAARLAADALRPAARLAADTLRLAAVESSPAAGSDGAAGGGLNSSDPRGCRPRFLGSFMISRWLAVVAGGNTGGI